MRLSIPGLWVVVAAVTTASAQTTALSSTNLAAGANQVAKPVAEKPVQATAIQPAPPPGAKSVVGGAVAQTVRGRKPWQMLNPFAPPAYGDGTGNVSLNPQTGENEGVVLVSIKLPSKPPKHKKERAAKPAR